MSWSFVQSIINKSYRIIAVGAGQLVRLLDDRDEVIGFIGNKKATNAEILEEEVPLELRMTLALESLVKKMDTLITEFRLAYTRNGESYGNRFQITPANRVMQIDLVRPELSTGIPVRLNLPHRPLPNITLINEGPGNLYFDTVKHAGDNRATTYLGSGTLINMDFREPTAERINIRCDANLTLNMIVLF